MIKANRRRFLCGSLIGAAAFKCRDLLAAADHPSTLATRGVVLIPEDLTLADWPERAKRAGLSTIGIHHQNSPKAVMEWVKSDAGQRFLNQCRTLGIEVEYELHAMKELLPRELFNKNPEWFRMNDQGERTSDANCCVHSRHALEIITENALTIAKALPSTTGRYFLWGDDGSTWCRCPKCRGLLPSEQALVVENAMLQALQQVDAKAQLAHLAYGSTLQAPKQIKPRQGIFLEFAPSDRRYDVPYSKQDTKIPCSIEVLDANLQVFPRETAHILEYWLDVSLHSQRRRPAVKVPWNRNMFLADVATYRQRGIQHITTFAAWIDADYKERFANLDFIDEYGAGLSAR